MNVLCIDDEPLALRLLVSMLKDKPDVKEIHSFSNTSDALVCAESKTFDLTFVDIMLGSTNGLDFAERLRTMQPTVRIIYCTGYPQYAIECINRGIVDGYLLKPIEEQQIQEILNRTCVQEPLTVTGSGAQLHIFDRYGQPVVFTRRKTMHLFSLLLELDGRDATVDELCTRLWEHRVEMVYKNRQYLYSLVSDLNITLKEHESAEVLIKTDLGYALDMMRIEKF